MKYDKTGIHEVFLLQPAVYSDSRGEFSELWNVERLSGLLNCEMRFVQQNYSRSEHNVLRGLHYQHKRPQGKLVQVLQGEVRDVVVDLRKSSPTYREWASFELSSSTTKLLWIPAGLAHGFYVESDTAVFSYHTTDYYNPGDEYTIRWDDALLDIDWGGKCLTPKLSEKDGHGLGFLEVPHFD